MNFVAHDMKQTMQLGGDEKASRLFIASIGRFDDAASIATIDALVAWIEDHYREDLLKRPSKHEYLRKLSKSVIEQMDQLRDSPVIHEQILRQFPDGSVITPMKHTDCLLYTSPSPRDS